MLRIRRSVQAKYNTEASYLAAQTLASRDGKITESAPAAAVDAMAAAEQASAPPGRGFVAAKHGNAQPQPPEASTANADEIQIDEDDV